MEIVRFDRLGETDNFDREVVLKCKGKTFCRASTKLQVTSPEVRNSNVVLTLEVLSLLVEKEMGFGQIFRYLQRIPQFSLLDCGKDDKKLWRHYTLTIPEGMHMVITEVFPASIFELNFDDGEEKFTKEVWDSVPDVQV